MIWDVSLNDNRPGAIVSNTLPSTEFAGVRLGSCKYNRLWDCATDSYKKLLGALVCFFSHSGKSITFDLHVLSCTIASVDCTFIVMVPMDHMYLDAVDFARDDVGVFGFEVLVEQFLYIEW